MSDLINTQVAVVGNASSFIYCPGLSRRELHDFVNRLPQLQQPLPARGFRAISSHYRDEPFGLQFRMNQKPQRKRDGEGIIVNKIRHIYSAAHK